MGLMRLLKAFEWQLAISLSMQAGRSQHSGTVMELVDEDRERSYPFIQRYTTLADFNVIMINRGLMPSSMKRPIHPNFLSDHHHVSWVAYVLP